MRRSLTSMSSGRVGAPGLRKLGTELGLVVDANLIPLGDIRQSGGKIVVAFAAEKDFVPAALVSNMVDIDCLPHSGRKLSVPEINDARWFQIDEAREMMLLSQRPILDRLSEALGMD